MEIWSGVTDPDSRTHGQTLKEDFKSTKYTNQNKYQARQLLSRINPLFGLVLFKGVNNAAANHNWQTRGMEEDDNVDEEEETEQITEL